MTILSDSEAFLFGSDEPVCPYTGLRTFTEDEAIYFRGREAHVTKCLALLAAERFVMITGASGDGKSSLVFAGLLPEVRAGFLRGRHSNWAVAPFRPERSPLHNMARALADALHLENNVSAVENELAQGFSALVKLYQASSLCPPVVAAADLSPAQQRRQQLEAANLLLVVDQFEEFFTNPENYAGDGPTLAAQTVVNLLLETTRLAQAENIPIYIVCTMRSDFVGQCAEFRGLIEQIGASQYFVPRLLRHEFVAVIKEPALLSGNRISERLVQRLLYDIHYGQDQLPVLQHALRRIWLAANQGREEMDLLHYAMVGGLADELPAADQARFAQWQASLSATQRQFLLARPSLRNVLDAHANQLYHEATATYNQDFQPALPPGTAERVIERTFRVLTRIDGLRVVRNRLTGGEITAILNDNTLSWPVVCRILRPFRRAGTTFLSPFVPEEGNDQEVLPPDKALDITHESLIRNWTHLAEWARSEAEDVRVAQDLLQQADRWQVSAEDKGFLLPIGLYSYFTQWNRRKQLNASWLSYYAAGPAAAPQQASAASQSLTLTRFLEASRRRLRLPLLVAHYGLGRLVAVGLLPVLLVGLGWWAWAQRQQQASYVAYTIVRERLPYLKSTSVAVADKAHLLINADRLKKFIYAPWRSGGDAAAYTFERQLDALDDTLALNIELGIYQQVNNAQYDNAEREHPWTQRILLDLDRRLTRAGSLAGPPKGQPALSARQRQLAVYTARTTMALAYYLAYAQLRPGPADSTQRHLASRQQALLRHLRDYAAREVATTAGPPPGPVEFGYCLRVLLAQGNFQPAELAFLDGLSPLVPGSAAQRQFQRFFPPNRVFYARGGQLKHSGGYLTSAIIFAARRQPAQLSQCLDILSGQAADLDDANGGLAVLPYLVKYELLTPANLTTLLQECSEVGEGFPFGEMYAATVYSLLSTSPTDEVYAVGVNFQATAQESACRTGSINADLLDMDRVSFALPTAVRDKTWAVLLETPLRVGSEKPLFVSGNGLDRSARNIPFLQAFLAKMHGTYQAELLHDARAADSSFTSFSQALAELKKRGGSHAALDLMKWNLGTAQEVEITQASSVNQDPVSYLQQPTRPKTVFVQAYYTCPFNAFFRYQLRQAAAQPVPDSKLVQLLDSVTFVEAAFPDRYASTRAVSLRTSSLESSRRNRPNLGWMKAIVGVPGLADAARQRRNEFLYRVSAAVQDSSRLRQFKLGAADWQLVRALNQQPDFAQVPLQLALSDLATALAGARRGAEAWALARRLPAPLPTITAIRVGEQVMLHNDRSQQAALDSFLVAYQQAISPHPLLAANSVIPLLYWQPAETSHQAKDFRSFATLLMQEGRPETQQTGPVGMCRGRTLADHSYQAQRDVPTYQAERFRQSCYTAIVAGLAHLETSQPGDGWREYDEKVLLKPTNYDGLTD